MKTEIYHLKPGTILDERYRIEEVIGEGGFGITYSGVCLHQEEKVAIKEFFWRDYVRRDCSVTNEVALFQEDGREDYEHQKKRFLKEARIIRDFSREPGIVHIRDYFEENQTAYIVMDFLEGQTLKKYVGQNGPMDPGEAFLLMLPFMETLKKIHSYGIIHRDISPDNLILGTDQTLTLIDFGAARDFSFLSEKTRSIVLKGGYAPCEQYDRHGRLGPWTDIYALCGVLYFCITKNPPEDAFQRMLHDELKTPGALGISIDPALEKILMKGLSLEISSRYQNMDAFMGAVREIIREVDPREIRRKWLIRIASVFCFLCVLAGAGFWYYQAHLAEFKFRGVETMTLAFSRPKESSQKEYEQDLEILEERIQVLTGEDNYILSRKKNGDVSVVMPADSYGAVVQNSSSPYGTAMELWEFINLCLAKPGKPSLNDFSLSARDVEKAQVKQGVLDGVSRSDASLPETGDYSYLEFTLTKEAADKLRDYVKENPGTSLGLYLDLSWNGETSYSGSLGWYSIYTFYEKDYRTFYLTGAVQSPAFYRLLAYELTHEPYENRLAYSYIPPSTWEDVDTSMIAGENQVNEEDLADPAVYVEYSCSSGSQDMPNGQWYNTVSDFKTLLDTLEIPYAFGISSFQEHSITLKLSREDLYLDLLYMLTEKDLSISDMGNTIQSLKTYSLGEDFTFVEKTNPSYHWEIQAASEYEKESILERTQKTLQNQRDSLYLLVGNSFKIAELPLTEEISNGFFTFSDFLWDTSRLKPENMRQFLYTMACETTNSSYYTLEHASFTDSRSLLDMGVDLESYEILESPRLEQIEQEAEKLDASISVDEAGNKDSLTVTLPFPYDEHLVEDFLETVKQLYQTCNLQDGYYRSVNFRMDTDQIEPGEDLSVYFSLYSDYTPTMTVYMGKKLAKAKQEELMEQLKTDSFYQPFAESEDFNFYTN